MQYNKHHAETQTLDFIIHYLLFIIHYSLFTLFRNKSMCLFFKSDGESSAFIYLTFYFNFASQRYYLRFNDKETEALPLGIVVKALV